MSTNSNSPEEASVNMALAKLAFVVQHTDNDPALCIQGKIISGKLSIGDEVRVTSNGDQARITNSTVNGHHYTLQLNKPLRVSSKDILSRTIEPLETTDQFEAKVTWLSQRNGIPGRNYNLKLLNQEVTASITKIKHSLNPDTQFHEAAKVFNSGDIGICNVATVTPIAFEKHDHSKMLGSFILIDPETQETVAEGKINHTLRRSENIHTQALSINREHREHLNGHKGKVIWFTGLSGSGKSTLANALEKDLHSRGMHTYILDGDNIRHGLNKDLGFTDEDRVENIRRIAEVSKLMMDAGLIVMTAFISPFRREREMARDLIGSKNFMEVYVDTPLAVCEERDIKGLYKKARAGQIPNMTGINSPYESPTDPELIVHGFGAAIEAIAEDIIKKIV